MVAPSLACDSRFAGCAGSWSFHISSGWVGQNGGTGRKRRNQSSACAVPSWMSANYPDSSSLALDNPNARGCFDKGRDITGHSRTGGCQLPNPEDTKRGGLLNPRYGERRPKMYHFLEAEMNSVSSSRPFIVVRKVCTNPAGGASTEVACAAGTALSPSTDSSGSAGDALALQRAGTFRVRPAAPARAQGQPDSTNASVVSNK